MSTQEIPSINTMSVKQDLNPADYIIDKAPNKTGT